ncbi:hypothetical protein RCL49_25225, partial [Salmonella enterica subsp. enterica serovar Typhimurium]
HKREEGVQVLKSIAEKTENPILKGVLLANIAEIFTRSNPDKQKTANKYYADAFDSIRSAYPLHVFLPYLLSQIAQVHSQLHRFSKALSILE